MYVRIYKTYIYLFTVTNLSTFTVTEHLPKTIGSSFLNLCKNMQSQQLKGIMTKFVFKSNFNQSQIKY